MNNCTSQCFHPKKKNLGKRSSNRIFLLVMLSGFVFFPPPSICCRKIYRHSGQKSNVSSNTSMNWSRGPSSLSSRLHAEPRPGLDGLSFVSANKNVIMLICTITYPYRIGMHCFVYCTDNKLWWNLIFCGDYHLIQTPSFANSPRKSWALASEAFRPLFQDSFLSNICCQNGSSFFKWCMIRQC